MEDDSDPLILFVRDRDQPGWTCEVDASAPPPPHEGVELPSLYPPPQHPPDHEPASAAARRAEYLKQGRLGDSLSGHRDRGHGFDEAIVTSVVVRRPPGQHLHQLLIHAIDRPPARGAVLLRRYREKNVHALPCRRDIRRARLDEP